MYISVKKSYEANLQLITRCECHEGFTAAYDGISCMDINECELNQHECDQR